MIAILTSLLGSISWGSVAALVAGLGTLLFGIFKTQQAKTAKAEATAAKADADKQVAQKDAEVAQGNLKASQAATEAVKAAQSAKQETASIPDADLDKVGEDMGIVRKD